MKLNENTVTMLKNFSNINSNMVFKEGNRISTIAEAKNILATVSLEDAFPKEFGIYDLNEFLGVIHLVDEPDLSFDEKFITVSDSTGRSKIKYFFTDIDMLTKPNDTMIEKASAMSDWNIRFDLDNDTLNKIKRAAQTLGHSSMSISANGGTILLTVFDPENSTSNSFSIDVPGTYDSENFNLVINISNLKILPGDYKVELSSNMSKFTGDKVTYWIALEKSSTYGE